MHFRRVVTEQRWLTEDELDASELDVEAQVDAAFAAAEASPWPDVSLVTADVYTTY